MQILPYTICNLDFDAVTIFATLYPISTAIQMESDFIFFNVKSWLKMFLCDSSDYKNKRLREIESLKAVLAVKLWLS